MLIRAYTCIELANNLLEVEKDPNELVMVMCLAIGEQRFSNRCGRGMRPGCLGSKVRH